MSLGFGVQPARALQVRELSGSRVDKPSKNPEHPL